LDLSPFDFRLPIVNLNLKTKSIILI
jgi:hypothetical protein